MDRILTSKDVIELIGISRATLARWIDSGKFPQPFRVGGRTEAKYNQRRWKSSVIQDWLDSQALNN